MAEQAGQPGFFSYSMERYKRGIAVIIGISEFDSKKILSLPLMTQVNIGNCRDAFKNLHFEEKICKKKTASDILDYLRDISNLNHTQYDCFVLYFSSHGGHGYFCCKDCKVGPKKNEREDGFIYISTLVDMFVNSNTLKDKPKLFFFDGCREDEPNIPVRDKKAPIELLTQENPQSTYADIFINYATIIGGSSLGPLVEQRLGNVYTNKLTECLNEFGRTKSFSEVMNQVNYRMKTDSDDRFLITEQNSTLCGSIEMKYLPESEDNVEN